MAPPDASYYRPDLALVHHLGFAFHADACAPGILALLESVRERGGVVLEVGCGSGLLTRHLIDRVEVRVGTSFGTETLPAGLRTVIGRRPEDLTSLVCG